MSFYLKVQQFDKFCSFELSWGVGQNIGVTLAYPENLTALYQEWQRIYLRFYNTQLRGRVEEIGSFTAPTVDLHAHLVQAEAQLLYEFHHWLRSAELYEIRAVISSMGYAYAQATKNSNNPYIDIFITCSPLELARLPWEVWEIGTEFALDFSKIRIVRTPINRRQTVNTNVNGKGVTTNQPVVDKPTLPLLQKIAKQQNATLVQYSVIVDENKELLDIYIWVIKPTGEVTFRAPDLKSKKLLKPITTVAELVGAVNWLEQNRNLAELVSISRESIGVRGGGVIVSENNHAAKPENQLKHLHELLINPIADLLPSKENDRVIFIPQSSLFLVPFPALQDEQGKYLIEKHTILTAPSIQVLDLTRRQRGAETATSLENALIVGNPIMPKVVLEPGQGAQELPNLKWAEKEAQDIASLLKTDAITGKKATKAAIVQKMPSARIIHLATHGILDDIRGLGSAIALAPSGNDNGLLTAEEILNLKLNANLVVLSACNTGRGRITGDGVIGLSRSLISAGVPSVIVSLWAVNDNSTSFLMTEFYQNLQQKLDKATAFRKAMLTTMQKYPEPLNWAAFTLIGEY